MDGLNRRGRETLAVLRRAVTLAKERGVQVFAVCGDLFHNRRPEPAVIRAVQAIFEEAGMPILLVPGNHDMLDETCAAGNTAMAPLYQVATIANSPTLSEIGPFSVLSVPFDGKNSMGQHLAEVADYMHLAASSAGVLLTHVGVFDDRETAPAWQRTARDGMPAGELFEAMEKAGVDLAFVGNYHDPGQWFQLGGKGRRIYQLGTLCPATHGDGGLVQRGRMGLVYEVSQGQTRVEFVEVPGPRFLTISTDACLAGTMSGVEEGFTYYGRLVVDLEAPDLLPPGWVVIEESGEAPAEEAEGPSLEMIDTPAQALRSYVADMALPEGARREAVLGLASRYWREAS